MQTTAHKIGTLGLATATVLGLTVFQPAEAASLYTVTDIGTLSGRENFAHPPSRINNAGQIVGTSGLRSFDAQLRAFLWDNGVMTDLGSLEGSNSEAFDINDFGQVVGHSEINSPDFSPFGNYTSHAFLWENGVMTDLGTFGGTNSSASSINNSGQVVGWAENERGEERAFLWENGEMFDLGTLGGTTSFASSINDSSQIVGNAVTSSGSNRAFLWENGEMFDLGTLGGTTSFAGDINESGQVVGIADLRGEGFFNHHAFLWQDGTMIDLGTLDDLPTSEALGINNAGQVVGNAYNFNDFNERKPFLWENGLMIDINSLIPADSGWELLVALDINDGGQIVGIGRMGDQVHDVLLTPLSDPTPVPEPLTLLGSATALGFGALFKREHSRRQKKAKSND